MGILNAQELQAAKSTVGSACTVHAATVVRVYTSPGSDGGWVQKCVGAATIVTDSVKKSHYLKVVELNGKQIAFEQELFKNFIYENPVPFFHTFETESEVAGFSFADEDDAGEFYDKVRYCMDTDPADALGGGGGGFASTAKPAPPPPTGARPPPPRPSTAPPSAPPPIPGGSSTPSSEPTPAVPSTPAAPAATATASAATPAKQQPKKKKFGFFSKLVKGDDQQDDLVLSEPTNFRHLSSIGWNADSGFEIRNIPPEWKKLFQSAGIKKKDLKNKDTAAMIMATIEENGGVEAIGGEGGPPPPGPPPPPAPAPPPPPSGPSIALPPGADTAGRGGLLESIRAGKQLQHVDENAINAPGSKPAANGMAGALASAMAARRGAIAEEDEEEEDEDWSEDWE